MRGFSAYILLVILPVLWLAAASPAAVRVYAKVAAETAIYPGEQFVYSVVVEGGSPSRIDISPLASFNPRDAGNASYRINGLTMICRNYAVTAGKAGVMHLPPVTVVVDGQTYTTDPVDVTVSASGTTDRMSLEFLVTEKQCYVGQPLVMTVKWVVMTRVQQGAFDVPVFKSDDFYIEDASEPANAVAREQTAIDGVPVAVTEERQLVRGVESAVLSFRKVLIPKRTGHLRLDPITVSASIAVGRERTNDLFNPYATKFQRVSVQSDPVELDVRPLPETDKPPQFYGLVGQYTISASAAPAKVNVGDPITLTIRIGGNPYLKPVQWPALELVPELAANFKIPAEKASPVLEGGSGSPTQNSALGGPSKVFTQTLRANSDKVTQVPAIPLAYFDPTRGAYIVAKTEPIKLEVAPSKVLTNVDIQGTGSAAPVGAQNLSPVQAIGKGLSANYYGPDVLENQDFSVLSLLVSPVYTALWSIPLLALLASSAVKLVGRTSPEALARKRRRRAAGVALAQLKGVSGAESGHKHEVLLSAMKGYIGDRFDKVAASLTADDCSHVIAEATGDTAAAAQYKELIDRYEAARYTPLRTNVGADQVQAARDLIQSVEKAATRRIADSVRAVSSIRNPKSAIRNERVGPKSYLLFLALCLLPCTMAKAAPSLGREQLYALLQEANTAFQGANAAHTPEAAKPLYDKAILLYEKIIDQGGIHNAKLYYNLANAYLLEEDLGRAILNYRRALQFDNADINIQKNLTFARSRRVDQIETSAEERVLQTLFFWHYDFALGTKLLLACASFAWLCVTLTLIVWRGRGPATGATAALAAVLLAALVVSCAVQAHRQANVHPGVITAAEVVARQGDGPNYPPSFKDPLHAGLEFELLEQRPGWLHLRLADGADAWVPADAAGLV